MEYRIANKNDIDILMAVRLEMIRNVKLLLKGWYLLYQKRKNSSIVQ